MNNTDPDLNTAFIILDRKLKILAVPLFIGIATITMNIVQFWFLGTKFKEEMNTLFIMIHYLCIGDLLNGVAMVSHALLSILHSKVFNGDCYLLQVIHVFRWFVGPYLLAVSTVTLSSLAVLKRLKVVKNRSYSRSIVKKICCSIWGTLFTLLVISYALNRLNVFSITKNLIFQKIWMQILVIYPSIILQGYCIGNIYYYITTRVRQMPPRVDGRPRSHRRFLRITPNASICYL